MKIFSSGNSTDDSFPRWIRIGFPTISADRDGQSNQCFWLEETLLIELSDQNWIEIPEGFVTDFASVPKFLWGIFPPVGDHNLADIIHDYLYTYQIGSRRQADREFYHWLTLLRPLPKSRIDNFLRYWAVRLFGHRPWRRRGKL